MSKQFAHDLMNVKGDLNMNPIRYWLLVFVLAWLVTGR